ncbi:hypothetical protein [uncultured Aquimarina sp.]|uniref:hypothetical protein n=1 Tax=uncultured Aquimarina sp. TaxID=575652 RepID=UPI002605FCBB|nr:hypothetical protein [uncultured Aquimarina sp.]
MKIVMIDSRIDGLVAACGFVAKEDKVIMFEKNASHGGIPLCLVNAKIVANEIPAL